MAVNFMHLRRFLAYKEIGTKIFIPIFYTVGVIGMLVPVSFPVFVKLVPLALILSLLSLSMFNKGTINKKSIFVFSFIIIASFLIEIVGVNTGVIFGNYKYGNSLGISILNTPVIIGFNWLLLVYATSSVFDSLRVHAFVKIVIASVLMLTYDIVLEQVAPKLDMWKFSGNIVPYQNYVAWFAISVLFHLLIKAFRINTQNNLAFTVLTSQFLFFLFLSFFLKH